MKARIAPVQMNCPRCGKLTTDKAYKSHRAYGCTPGTPEAMAYRAALAVTLRKAEQSNA